MTRMTRTRVLYLPLALFAMAFLAVGCGPDAKQKKIDDLSAENDQLKKEVEDRDRQLNDGTVRDNDSRSTIDELNRQLAKLRTEGAKGGKEGEWVSVGNFDMMSIGDTVLFESGKADLKASGKTKLAQVASEIRSKYGDRDIFVIGHTDDQPIRKSKWKDNLELGAHRSLTVVRSLRDLGVPGEYLVQANCGEYRPKTANANDKTRAQNRRVEFYAVQRKGGASLEKTATAKHNSDE